MRERKRKKERHGEGKRNQGRQAEGQTQVDRNRERQSTYCIDRKSSTAGVVPPKKRTVTMTITRVVLKIIYNNKNSGLIHTKQCFRTPDVQQ